jgi:hypothetical protein
MAEKRLVAAKGGFFLERGLGSSANVGNGREEVG